MDLDLSRLIWFYRYIFLLRMIRSSDQEIYPKATSHNVQPVWRSLKYITPLIGTRFEGKWRSLNDNTIAAALFGLVKGMIGSAQDHLAFLAQQPEGASDADGGKGVAAGVSRRQA